ncbi:MAG TPA: hypothetical protein VFK06_25120 [Candidatus Angelobacter sp.]|nr:hypothetical protein [Candidatus Angelobacter sp.]
MLLFTLYPWWTMNLEMQMEQLKKLYPDLSAEELLRVKDTLDQYLLLAWEIFEDMQKKDVPEDY